MTVSRRGMSLTELLVVMTACSALLTLSSGLICRMMRVHVDSRAYDSAERNANRLAESFRRDVHRARSVTRNHASSRDAELLQVELADGRQAKYSWQNGTMLREETGGDRPASREEFELPTTCDLAVEELSAPQRIALTVSSDLKARLQDDPKVRPVGQLVPINLQVEAVVGRDARMSARSAPEEATE
jgi:prepilin-type N-terminal cleavage/methylation domain-containing protein